MKKPNYSKTDLGKSFALTVATMLVANILLSLVFSQVGRYKVVDSEDITKATMVMYDWAFWLMNALYSVAIGSAAFLYAALTKTNVLCATTMNKKPPLAHIGWGCLSVVFLVCVMTPLNEFLLDGIEQMGLPRPSVDMPMQIVPMIFVACLIPAFTEEVVFRGTVTQSLANNSNKVATILLSGALFSIFHMNPAQTIHQFVLGALLALLVLRSGSLWTTSAVHLFNNLLAVVLSFTLPDETLFTDYWYIFVPVGIVGFAASVFGYIKTTQSNWKPGDKKDEEDDPAAVQASARDAKMSNVYLLVAVGVCVALWIVNLFGVGE